MRIYRRKDTAFYWTDFSVDGHRVRRSTGATSREAAALIARAWRDDLLVQKRAGGSAPRHISLDDALGRYWVDHAKDIASAPTIGYQGDSLRRVIGGEKLLAEIDDAVVSDYVSRRRGEKVRRGHGPRKGKTRTVDRLVGNGTVNRELGLLKAVMRMAARRWKYTVGAVEWEAHRLREAAPRQRYLTPDQARAVIAAAAAHARPAIAAALYTGLRLANVMRLDWSQVDLRRLEIAVRVKSKLPGGKLLTLPIAPPLLVVLANQRPREAGPVFRFRYKPVKSMRKAFATALERAGIADFHWHDLRHTAASLMLDAGVQIDQVKEALGHADIRTTLRYAHRPKAAMRDAFARLGDTLAHGTPAAQTDSAGAENGPKPGTRRATRSRFGS